MGLKRLAVSALAAVFALSGIGSILVMNHQPSVVDAVDLTGEEPAIRRQDDDGRALEVVDDDDVHGDGDATKGDDGTSGGDNTVVVHGDGDATKGDDGTSGGDNTGDGDATRGDDGTSGGDNTGANTNTGGGDTTD
jgi:hypothetical protein